MRIDPKEEVSNKLLVLAKNIGSTSNGLEKIGRREIANFNYNSFGFFSIQISKRLQMPSLDIYYHKNYDLTEVKAWFFDNEIGVVVKPTANYVKLSIGLYSAVKWLHDMNQKTQHMQAGEAELSILTTARVKQEEPKPEGYWFTNMEQYIIGEQYAEIKNSLDCANCIEKWRKARYPFVPHTTLSDWAKLSAFGSYVDCMAAGFSKVINEN